MIGEKSIAIKCPRCVPLVPLSGFRLGGMWAQSMTRLQDCFATMPCGTPPRCWPGSRQRWRHPDGLRAGRMAPAGDRTPGSRRTLVLRYAVPAVARGSHLGDPGSRRPTEWRVAVVAPAYRGTVPHVSSTPPEGSSPASIPARTPSTYEPGWGGVRGASSDARTSRGSNGPLRHLGP
jgi:hypothetical protein